MNNLEFQNRRTQTFERIRDWYVRSPEHCEKGINRSILKFQKEGKHLQQAVWVEALAAAKAWASLHPVETLQARLVVRERRENNPLQNHQLSERMIEKIAEKTERLKAHIARLEADGDLEEAARFRKYL